ncbi:MAG: hypothetical protein PWP71_2372 [Clostridia bacterium]|jgi:2-keto-4-pentenoate hydratase/2-oxohepta-3-ene-1,7-dioic acid hydratase in catechol pathway|nr:hypothetical protein [Clostridia bacterium]
MKFIRFSLAGEIGYGVLQDGVINPIEGDLFNNYKILEKTIDLKDVKLLPPISPGKIIAVGLNYLDHVGEVSAAASVPEEPMTFMVSNTAVIGPDDNIKLASYERRTDHECELVVVIGKECFNVSEDKALDYVFGYTCGNDVSDREIQKKDGQWTRAKSFPTYKPLGPWIETELDPTNLDIQTYVNGELKQNSNTKHMIFPVARLISFLSSFMILYPGDVIYSGTPQGVSPIKSGDVVEVKIHGIGVLKNKVI